MRLALSNPSYLAVSRDMWGTPEASQVVRQNDPTVWRQGHRLADARLRVPLAARGQARQLRVYCSCRRGAPIALQLVGWRRGSGRRPWRGFARLNAGGCGGRRCWRASRRCRVEGVGRRFVRRWCAWWLSLTRIARSYERRYRSCLGLVWGITRRLRPATRGRLPTSCQSPPLMYLKPLPYFAFLRPDPPEPCLPCSRAMTRHLGR